MVEGAGNGLDLPKHMAEHIYMFSGKSIRIEMKAKNHVASEIIDRFGMDVEFKNEDKEYVTAVVYANEHAMKYWALQYAPYITVMSPNSLAETIRYELREAIKNYGENRNECTNIQQG